MVKWLRCQPVPTLQWGSRFESPAGNFFFSVVRYFKSHLCIKSARQIAAFWHLIFFSAIVRFFPFFFWCNLWGFSSYFTEWNWCWWGRRNSVIQFQFISKRNYFSNNETCYYNTMKLIFFFFLILIFFKFSRMWQHGVWTCRVWTGSFSTIRRWRPRSTCIGWGVRPASASAARPWSSYRRPKSNSSVDWAPEASSQLLSFTFYLLLRAHQYFPVSSLFILNFAQFNLNGISNDQFWMNYCALTRLIK